MDEQYNPLKRVIIILAVLIAVSLVALAGVKIYKNSVADKTQAVTVPDNIITPDKDAEQNGFADGQTSAENSKDTAENGSASGSANANGSSSASGKKPQSVAELQAGSVVNKTEFIEKLQGVLAGTIQGGMPGAATGGTSGTTSGVLGTTSNETTGSAAAGGQNEVKISINKKHPDANQPFNAQNMFPGDTIAQDYRVQVSHKGAVTVYFDAVVRDGYEKLAEVLKCRVILSATGEEAYNGLLKDTSTITYKVDSGSQKTSEIPYKIEVYLDTSVGNEYMNKPLVADFEWWVEKEENLSKPTDTDKDGSSGSDFEWWVDENGNIHVSGQPGEGFEWWIDSNGKINILEKPGLSFEWWIDSNGIIHIKGVPGYSFDLWIDNNGVIHRVPYTGDTSHTYLWAGLMAASAIVIGLIAFKRKKEADDEQ